MLWLGRHNLGHKSTSERLRLQIRRRGGRKAKLEYGVTTGAESASLPIAILTNMSVKIPLRGAWLGLFGGVLCLARLPGQSSQPVDFAALLKTPAGIQSALERCDGHPDFETALANWLEAAQPRSAEEQEAIRKASLRLLEDTSDPQVVLGLLDGLMRQALSELSRDPAVVPEELAKSLYSAIGRAVGRQPRKWAGFPLLASGLKEGGAANGERHAAFVKELLTMSARRRPAAPRLAGSTSTSPSASAANSASR
jgi:hypothetical protein